MTVHPRRFLLAAIAGLAAFAVACGGAPGTLGGTPVPGSDEWHEEQRERENTEALAALDAALGRVDPCRATKDQITDVLRQLERLQRTGADSDALTSRVRTAMAPAAKSIARAVARGESVGYTGEEAAQLARDFGINDRLPGWMDDNRCEQRWLAVVNIHSTWGGVSFVDMDGRVPLAVTPEGAVTGSASATVATTYNAPPGCTASYTPGVAEVTVEGQRVGDSFHLTVTHGGYVTTGTLRCAVASASVPITIPPIGKIPVTILAKGGEQAQGGGGAVTLTLLTQP